MCIEKIESYSYAGKLYTTEEAAVKAALNEIGNRIMKDFSHEPSEGLTKNANELIDLLGKWRSAQFVARAGKGTSEKGRREPIAPIAVQGKRFTRLLKVMESSGATKPWLQTRGYADLIEFSSDWKVSDVNDAYKCFGIDR